jgi:hypothetical protein
MGNFAGMTEIRLFRLFTRPSKRGISKFLDLKYLL